MMTFASHLALWALVSFSVWDSVFWVLSLGLKVLRLWHLMDAFASCNVGSGHIVLSNETLTLRQDNLAIFLMNTSRHHLSFLFDTSRWVIWIQPLISCLNGRLIIIFVTCHEILRYLLYLIMVLFDRINSPSLLILNQSSQIGHLLLL